MFESDTKWYKIKIIFTININKGTSQKRDSFKNYIQWNNVIIILLYWYFEIIFRLYFIVVIKKRKKKHALSALRYVSFRQITSPLIPISTWIYVRQNFFHGLQCHWNSWRVATEQRKRQHCIRTILYRFLVIFSRVAYLFTDAFSTSETIKIQDASPRRMIPMRSCEYASGYQYALIVYCVALNDVRIYLHEPMPN